MKSPSFAVGLLLARELGVDPAYPAFGDAGIPGTGPVPSKQTQSNAALERRIEAIERTMRAHLRRR